MERRNEDRREDEERRIGTGCRIRNRRMDEIAVEDDKRTAVRRDGFSRRGEAMRREVTRRIGERRVA